MPIYEITPDKINPIPRATFAETGLSERNDLQRLLRDRIEILSPDTLVIAEEFSDWDDSKRRIDLLGIDRDAKIVVIELKRTEDGGHMELQALRYAAMVSTMTFERAVKALAELRAIGADEAQARLLEFLRWGEPDEERFAQDVRIVSASAEFSKELATAVLWLNQRDLDIRCVRLRPYRDGARVLIDVAQVLPLPEAQDYQVRLREKETRERQSSQSWDREGFMAALRAAGADVATAERFLAWSSEQGFSFRWTRGKEKGGVQCGLAFASRSSSRRWRRSHRSISRAMRMGDRASRSARLRILRAGMASRKHSAPWSAASAPGTKRAGSARLAWIRKTATETLRNGGRVWLHARPGAGKLDRRKQAKAPARSASRPKLWQAADALRNNMDAAEYKHVVLGLIFLKYISDAFEAKHAELEAEQAQGADPEDPDEYRAASIFWVPKEARWSHLKASAPQPTIGTLVDDAMAAIERDNPSLKGVLPKDYARPGLDKQRLGQLINLVSATSRLGDAGRPRQGHARPRLRVLPRPVRQRRGQEGRPVLHAAPRRPRARRDARARTRAASTTRAAARAACSCRARSSSRRTAAASATSPSTARSPTTPPGAWPR